MKIFEMFAGYGTATFALKELGIEHEVVGFSEIDKYAIQCFQQNHGSKNYGDATKINPNELPDFDLLTGGFPCQAFSIAGKGLGELDTRGTLFNEIIRIAEVKQPKYMLLENVKGLLNKKHKPTFEKILSELKRIGYFVKWKVLNTKDYGIPQNRERVWFVCFKEESDYLNFEFPEKEELKIFLKDILENIPFRDIPKFQFNYYGGKKRIDYLKTVKDKYFHTLTTNRSHANQYLLNENKTKCRLFVKKECFRLQGFLKDQINLNGITNNQAHKIAGNGQSLNVVMKIFKEMFR